MGFMGQSASSKYVIIGAGIHGLSTAYHLALQLKATGKGSGEDILVLDKNAIGGGASGIACGVVRNNYFQPAMRELMAAREAYRNSEAAKAAQADASVENETVDAAVAAFVSEGLGE